MNKDVFEACGKCASCEANNYILGVKLDGHSEKILIPQVFKADSGATEGDTMP